jgi:hypothetical protein
MTQRYGKASARALLNILDGYDSYLIFHVHSHKLNPGSSAPQSERDAHALKFAVSAVDMWHYVEDSNPDHTSWMGHITWAVAPEFLAAGKGW